jgi:hypothetical protein
MKYRYRIARHGGVYRKANGEPAETYNFMSNTWKVSVWAEDAFFIGEDTYEATEEQALKKIEDTKKRLNK